MANYITVMSREDLAQFLYEARLRYFGDWPSWTALPHRGRYGREAFLAMADAVHDYEAGCGHSSEIRAPRPPPQGHSTGEA